MSEQQKKIGAIVLFLAVVGYGSYTIFFSGGDEAAPTQTTERVRERQAPPPDANAARENTPREREARPEVETPRERPVREAVEDQLPPEQKAERRRIEGEEEKKSRQKKLPAC